ncbi:MAG: hypothetical protein R3D00_06130 [Bacteroidia bacterium]
MNNVSTNGESLSLLPEKRYYVIDALYLNDIKDKINSLDQANLDQEIREKVFAFPRTDTPFVKYASNRNIFSIEQIKKVNYNEEMAKDTIFSTDTGMILLIEQGILIDFMQNFDYDTLTDSLTDLIDIKYWDELTNRYAPGLVNLAIAPGIQSGFDFEGSGTYKITFFNS